MIRIASSAQIHPGVSILTTQLEIGERTIIYPGVILGLPNSDYTWFESNGDRGLKIGNDCLIMPGALLFEGARIGDAVTLEEHTTVGSITTIGHRTRLVFHAQVYHGVTVGEDCIIGALVANNSSVGSRCSIFGPLVHKYSGNDPTQWNTLDEPGPTIEDGVLVGMGAVVAGAVRIGAKARILPNALVSNDLPPNSVVKK